MDLEAMGKVLWGKKMDLKDQDIDFSLGSQAELSYAKLSRQRCSMDPLSQWI